MSIFVVGHEKIAEISDVLSGKSKGRSNDNERILAYNIGFSIHDVYFAEQIYRLATEAGIGTEIDLYPPAEKFWLE